jgi:hypothetical protein
MVKTKRLAEAEEIRRGMQRFLADWENRSRSLTELRADVIEVRRVLESKLESPPAG